MRPQLGVSPRIAADYFQPEVGGACLGLVSKPISTGDRTILGKISKRGNRNLRIQSGQAVWVVLIKPRS